MKRLAQVLVAITTSLLFCAPAAYAQAGYPGTTTTRPPEPTRERINAGQFGPTDTYNSESCGFTAGSTALVSWNGEDAGTAVADASGCVHVDVRFQPSDSASGNSCADAYVNSQPTAYEAKRGSNDLVITGTGANGAAREVGHQLILRCSGGSGADATVSAKSAELGRSGAASGDGSAEAASVAPGTAGSVDTSETPRAWDGLLPTTGGSVLRWVAVAFLLIAVGGLAVVIERRRLADRVS